MFDELGPRIENKKVLILGIGNRQRGDDGVGCFLVHRLRGKVHIPALDGGVVPEKQLGPIEDVCPDVVLVVVAADVPNAAPGEITILELDQLRSSGVTPHAADPSLLFKIIPKISRPEVIVIAVQPGISKDGKGVSNAVRVALDGLEALCVELFG